MLRRLVMPSRLVMLRGRDVYFRNLHMKNMNIRYVDVRYVDVRNVDIRNVDWRNVDVGHMHCRNMDLVMAAIMAMAW